MNLVNVTYWNINELDNDLAWEQNVAEQLNNIKTVLCRFVNFLVYNIT